jgi:hypothetical protein
MEQQTMESGILNRYDRITDLRHYEEQWQAAQLDAPRLADYVEDGEFKQHPYLIEEKITPGKIIEFFNVEKQSRVVFTVILFRSEEDKELYLANNESKTIKKS